jgi:hypothetical protein
MSRIGLNKRLAVVRNVLLPPGSLAHRLYQLKPWELQQYNEWCDRCDRWYAEIEAEHGPGAAYEQYLASTEEGASVAWEPPQLHLPLRRKLFPEPPPRSGDPAEDYLEMIRDGE